MANWQDFLAALGAFGGGASQGIAQVGQQNRQMEFQQGQQERVFGQQEAMQRRLFQQQHGLEMQREAAREGTQRRLLEFQTQKQKEAENVPFGEAFPFLKAMQPEVAAKFQPTMPSPERAETELAQPAAIVAPETIRKEWLPYLFNRPAKPGMKPEDFMRFMQGGGGGGQLETEFTLPMEGGGTAKFVRPRPEAKSPEARAQMAYENIAAGRGTAEDDAIIRGYEQRARAGQEFKNLTEEQLVAASLKGGPEGERAAAILKNIRDERERMARIRPEAFGNIRIGSYIDTKTGRVEGMSSNAFNEASAQEPGRYIPYQAGMQTGQVPGDVLARSATIKGLTTGMQALERQRATIEAFMRTNDKNLMLAEQISDAVARADVPALNRLLIPFKQRVLGSADVAGLRAALQVGANEAARVLTSATGAGVLTDTARKEIESLLNAEMTPAQVRRVVAVLRQDMVNRQRSYDEQRAAIQGSLQSLGTGGGVAAPLGAPAPPQPAPGAANPARPPGMGTDIESDPRFQSAPDGATFTKQGRRFRKQQGRAVPVP